MIIREQEWYKPDKKNKYPLVEFNSEKFPVVLPDQYAIEKGCWFDEQAAKRVITFFEGYLKHTIDPWAGKPFKLLDWQKYNLIAPLFGWKRKDGTRRFRLAYIEIPKKNGKALALNTLIPTPDGWKTMGNLMPGDEVFDAKGAPCTVVAATDVMEGRPCYRVSFSDGTSVIADAEHLWRTHTRKPENHYDIWTTKELTESLFLDYKGSEGYNHSIRLERCLELPPKKLEIHPYVLGCWLGDGTSKSANITASYEDMEILENIERCGVSVSERKSSKPNSGSFILGSNGRGKERFFSLQAKLRKLGVLRNKHIPMQYLRADPSQRRALLQGLMDTDGYVSKAGQCEFTTTSKPLCEGFLDLARGLGYKPTLKTCRATLNGVDCGEKYRVQFWGFREQVVFGLSRKQERLKPIPKKRPRSKTVHIIAVEPVPSVPVRCIQVSSPDGMFLCGEGMIPTHNSGLCSGLGLYLTSADGEQGAQVYTAAADRSQAGIVFNESARMVIKSPYLRKRLKTRASTKTIYHPKSNSIYQALSADVPTKEGLNIHGLIFDELHAQKKRDLWDALRYGGAARDQPLIISITTAGFDRRTVCWEQHAYARKVLRGQVIDPYFFALIYSTNWEDVEARTSTEEEFDWRSEKAWFMANPSLGEIIKLEDFRQECLEAQDSPEKENSFKRYRLNIWTRAETRWFSPEKWKACGGEFDINLIKNRRCFGGLDMASVEDLASFTLVFEPGEDGLLYILNWSWCPLENMWKRVKKHRVPYDKWHKDGYLIATDGNAIDEKSIIKKIIELKKEYPKMSLIGFDRWGALSVTQKLEEEGLKVIPIGQGFASLSAPSKTLERAVLDETLRHGDNPVMEWASENVVVARDPSDNIKPVKDKSTEKIDPIVSLVIAVAAWQHATEEAESPYTQRGIITL